MFERMATTTEVRSPYPDGVKKWGGPIEYAVVGIRSQGFDTQLAAQFRMLAELTGIPVREAVPLAATRPPGGEARQTAMVRLGPSTVVSADLLKPEEGRPSYMTIGTRDEAVVFRANFFVIVGQRSDILYLANAISLEKPARDGLNSDRLHCVVKVTLEDGRIALAMAFLRTDIEPWRARRCLVEEISQGFGLLNDVPGSPVTLFDDKPGPGKTELLPVDRLLLAALYDRRITHGLRGREFRQRAFEVLEELRRRDWGQGAGAR